MKDYKADKIINVALAGHSGSGKTALAEAMLFIGKTTDRLGKVSEGNTVSDFDPEEIRRKASIFTSVAPFIWNDTKINIIDTPGLFDFAAGLVEGVRAADSVIINVSGKTGVEVGTEKAFKAAQNRNIPRIFFVNGLDDENSRFYEALDSLKNTFGKTICPIIVPHFTDGKVDSYINLLEMKAYTYHKGEVTEVPMQSLSSLDELKTAINEAVAETSDELLDKYFAGEDFSKDEVLHGLSKGFIDGTVAPVFCGDAFQISGMDLFMNTIVELLPRADAKGYELAEDDNGEPINVKIDENEPTSAIVFKTVSDPFIGKLSYFKVISGKISTTTPLINTRTGNMERISKVMIPKGKKQEEAKFIVAGDIGVAPKLLGTMTGDTLCDPNRKIKLEGVNYPTPLLSMAILPKTKGDEDKVAQGCLRICEEDPTLHFHNNLETHEMILSGMGEQHLDVVISKLRSKFAVEAVLKVPKVAYRETIKTKVQVQGRHKKQTGGHGQFGDVHIEFEPCECESLEFCEKVVGGAVPKGYFPAVEKGLLECIQHGTLAGYPVVGLKATLYDGSYHPVDSSEMAFKMAATLAYKAGIPKASPVILEPIGTLKAVVPDSNMGDVMGEINKRRGRVLGMDPSEDGMQVVQAEVPEAEMSDFSTFIRQCTQGRGSYTFDFIRYEEAPGNIATAIIEESNK